MPTITYLDPQGAATTVEVATGTSIMRAALQNGISGIVGECGGQAMCATCHIFVPVDLDLPEPHEDEQEMLDCTAVPRAANSRLGCQLRAGENFDQITVTLPDTQV